MSLSTNVFRGLTHAVFSAPLKTLNFFHFPYCKAPKILVYYAPDTGEQFPRATQKQKDQENG